MGSGTCVGICPSVFAHDAEGLVEILNERPPPEVWAAVMDAVSACPSEALSIEPELGDTDPPGEAP
jgi:ferredoxin